VEKVDVTAVCSHTHCIVLVGLHDPRFVRNSIKKHKSVSSINMADQ